MNFIDFHIQDGLLCHLGHLYVPVRKCEKMIWEAHYSRMTRHFGVKKTLVILHKHFIGQKFNRTSASISYLALPVPFPSQPLRSKPYTPLFLLLRGLGNPSRWITCLALHPLRKEMIVYLWWLISFQRRSLSQPKRRASQR
jgi:hypothetical protein